MEVELAQQVSLFHDFSKGLVQWRSLVQPAELPIQCPAMETLNNANVKLET